MVYPGHPGRLDQHRGAARRPRCFGILPFVADDKRLLQVQMPLEAGFYQQARFCGFGTSRAADRVPGSECFPRNVAAEAGVPK